MAENIAFNILERLDITVMGVLKTLSDKPVALIAGGAAMLMFSFTLIWWVYKCYKIFIGLEPEPFLPFLKEFGIKLAIFAIVAAAASGGGGDFDKYVKTPLMTVGDNLAKSLINYGGGAPCANTSQDPNNAEVKANKEEYRKSKGLNGEPSAASSIFGDMDCRVGKVIKEMQDLQDKNLNAEIGAWDILTSPIETMKNIIIIIDTWAKKIVVLTGFVILGIAVFIVIFMNQVFFQICLAVAPLFIFCAAFDRFKGWFDSWLSITLGYMFGFPCVVIAVSGLMGIFENVVSIAASAKANPEMGSPAGSYTVAWSNVGMVFLISVIYASLMGKIAELASQLFGAGNSGASTASKGIGKGLIGGFMVGKFIGFGAGKMIGKGIGKAAMGMGKGGVSLAKSAGKSIGNKLGKGGGGG